MTARKLQQKYLPPGWRSGVVFSALSAFIVLIINVSFTAWGVSRQRAADNSGNGSVVLARGSCARTHTLSVGIHFLINIFSTALLAGSNYCMQCLSAPTRRDVDQAHKKGLWLDIGVSGIHNLKNIPRQRVILWALLLISSLPLHILYNSSVFPTTADNAYLGFIVKDSFLQPNADMTIPLSTVAEAATVETLHQKYLAGELHKLDKNACIDAYATTLQTTHGDLLLVAEETDYSKTLPSDVIGQFGAGLGLPGDVMCPMNPYKWICGTYSKGCPSTCQDELPLVLNSANWTVDGYNIKYCLSSDLPDNCEVQFSKPLAIVVIICNVIKLLVMIYVACYIRDRPLVTIGDAIASFTERPDPTTTNMCLVSKSEIVRKVVSWPSTNVHAKPFSLARRRWFSSSSLRRWLWFIAIYVVALGICIFFLAYGISRIHGNKTLSSLWSAGLGAVDGRLLIIWDIPRRGASGLVGSTLVANIPQLVLSLMYFACNGLITSMLLSREWSSFGISHRVLRRSSPLDTHKNSPNRTRDLRGSSEPKVQQKSTYFLQLPYRYALPLMTLSVLLHWLVSQSIFLVSVAGYAYSTSDVVVTDYNDQTSPERVYSANRSWVTCGYSPVAITAAIVVSLVLVGSTVALGMRRLPSAMPVAASCSAAISAACHFYNSNNNNNDNGETLMVTGPVRWGVTTPGGSRQIGHCAFSMDDVHDPVPGQMYAGGTPELRKRLQ